MLLKQSLFLQHKAGTVLPNGQDRLILPACGVSHVYSRYNKSVESTRVCEISTAQIIRYWKLIWQETNVKRIWRTLRRFFFFFRLGRRLDCFMRHTRWSAPRPAFVWPQLLIGLKNVLVRSSSRGVASFSWKLHAWLVRPHQHFELLCFLAHPKNA